jgi:hypothetical protein
MAAAFTVIAVALAVTLPSIIPLEARAVAVSAASKSYLFFALATVSSAISMIALKLARLRSAAAFAAT